MANHIAADCWEDHSGSGVIVKGKLLKKEHAKESSFSALVVESDDSDSEYSRPKSWIHTRYPLIFQDGFPTSQGDSGEG